MNLLIKNLVLIVWMPMLLTLYPLPQDRIAQLETAIGQTHSAPSDPAKGFDHEIERRALNAEVWRGWLIGLFVTSVGIFSAIVAVRGGGYWKALTIFTSLLFLLLWGVDNVSAPELVQPTLLYFQSDNVVLNII